jgi:predicted glycosyltransferase
VQGELLGALVALRSHGGRAVLGLRDVLDDPADEAHRWRATGLSQLTEELYDRVLIYGSREVLDPLSGGLFSPELASRTYYCGYVVADTGESEPIPLDASRPVALATAGGGEDGVSLLDVFVDACRGAPWQGMLVAGPQMREVEWTDLRDRAQEEGVIAHRAVPSLPSWFHRVGALVCMGGYNTLVEAVAAGTPTVCVPRVRPRREQLIRAECFAARGLLQLVEPERLTSTTLSQAIDHALSSHREPRVPLDLHGARQAAELLVELLRVPKTPPNAATLELVVR